MLKEVLKLLKSVITVCLTVTSWFSDSNRIVGEKQLQGRQLMPKTILLPVVTKMFSASPKSVVEAFTVGNVNPRN